VIEVGSGNAWNWSSDVNPEVSFCVWVLITDGLFVAPFKSHPDRAGRLQALGFNQDNWLAWLRSVVTVDSDLHARLRPGTLRPPPGLIERKLHPYMLFDGARPVIEALAELYAEYQPVGAAWKRRMVIEEGMVQRLGPREGRKLWSALQPYRSSLPTLRIYVVDYAWPALLLVPPVSALIGSQASQAGTYAQAVLEAAHGLSVL
jgi:hypothetical protein